MADNPTRDAESVVPFDARKAMQSAIFEMFKMENEWTTWSDSVALAEAAAQALEDAGFVVTKSVKPMADNQRRFCDYCDDNEEAQEVFPMGSDTYACASCTILEDVRRPSYLQQRQGSRRRLPMRLWRTYRREG